MPKEDLKDKADTKEEPNGESDESKKDESHEKPEEKPENRPTDDERRSRDVLHFSKKQFSDRLEQAKRSGVTDLIKELGYGSSEDLQTAITLLKEKNPEQIEKLMKEKIEVLSDSVSTLQADLASSSLSKDVLISAFKYKLNDPAYGEFLYLRNLETLTDEELSKASPSQFFKTLKDDKSKAHLFESVKKPADTRPEDSPSPKDDSGSGEINVLNMDDAAYTKFKKKLGLRR